MCVLALVACCELPVLLRHLARGVNVFRPAYALNDSPRAGWRHQLVGEDGKVWQPYVGHFQARQQACCPRTVGESALPLQRSVHLRSGASDQKSSIHCTAGARPVRGAVEECVEMEGPTHSQSKNARQKSRCVMAPHQEDVGFAWSLQGEDDYPSSVHKHHRGGLRCDSQL